MKLKVLSINIHKGKSPLNLQNTMHGIKECIRQSNPDIAFIQEFQEKNVHPNIKFPSNAPDSFSQDLFSHWHYGKNVDSHKGHHGNLILSRLPQKKGLNYDISAYRFERRGLLHSEIVFNKNGVDIPIHCFCVHLALLQNGRTRQLQTILSHIEKLAHGQPTIIAGDFNDWLKKTSHHMKPSGLIEVFEALTGKVAKTFPSIYPILAMDRIYVRDLKIQSASILNESPNISDHLGIVAELEII
jgi:endonuclease/exonuclease/phosphatase family metal-dependent hydrolase